MNTIAELKNKKSSLRGDYLAKRITERDFREGMRQVEVKINELQSKPRNIKQINFPAYYRNGTTYSCLISEKEFVQVKFMQNGTRLEKSRNVHEIKTILEGAQITRDSFNRACEQANERITIE